MNRSNSEKLGNNKYLVLLIILYPDSLSLYIYIYTFFPINDGHVCMLMIYVETVSKYSFTQLFNIIIDCRYNQFNLDHIYLNHWYGSKKNLQFFLVCKHTYMYNSIPASSTVASILSLCFQQRSPLSASQLVLTPKRVELMTCSLSHTQGCLTSDERSQRFHVSFISLLCKLKHVDRRSIH